MPRPHHQWQRRGKRLSDLSLVSLRGDETGNAPIQAPGPQSFKLWSTPLIRSSLRVDGLPWASRKGTWRDSPILLFRPLILGNLYLWERYIPDISPVRAVLNHLFPAEEAIEEKHTQQQVTRRFAGRNALSLKVSSIEAAVQLWGARLTVDPDSWDQDVRTYNKRSLMSWVILICDTCQRSAWEAPPQPCTIVDEGSLSTACLSFALTAASPIALTAVLCWLRRR